MISGVLRSGWLGGTLGLAFAGALLLAAWQVSLREPHLLLIRDGAQQWRVVELYRSGAKCGAQLRREVPVLGVGRVQCLRVGDRAA